MSSGGLQDIQFFHSTSSSLTGEAVHDMVHAMHGKESVVPAAVTSHYLARSGCNISDDNVINLVSFSTQKLIADILREAKEHKELTDHTSDTRGKYISSTNIQYALVSHGIEVVSPPYLLDAEQVNVVEQK